MKNDEYLNIIEKFKEENKELIENGKCKKVFLENLPKIKQGIDWSNTKDYYFYFIYDKIQGYMKITEYNKKITLEYNNLTIDILSGNLKKCQLGAMFGKYIKEYRFNIDKIIKDDFGKGIILKQLRIGKANHKGYKIKCKNCDHTYERTENHIINRDGFKCPNCYNKGNSYGEKFMFNVLQQLSVNFIKENTFNWSKDISHKNIKICGDKRYDFHINDYNILMEIHGNQHYEEGFQNIRSKNLKEEQENDRLKKALALANGIKEENYIIIDCRKSELEWIKEHILNSRLNELFDLSKIDWLKCHEYACKDIIQYISQIKNENPNMTINDIVILTNLGTGAVRTYIKQASEMSLCYYNPKEEMKRSGQKAGLLSSIKLGKEIICIDNGIIIKNSAEYERKSVNIFDEILNRNGISRVCRGERTHYKGHRFKFTSDLTEEQIKEIQDNAKLNQAI